MEQDNEILPKQNQNVYPPLWPTFIGTFLYWASGLAVAGVGAVIIATHFEASRHKVVIMALGALIAAYFYLNGLKRQCGEREPKLWQWQVRPELSGFWISEETFDRLRFCLRAMRSTKVSENVVHLVTRRTKWYLGFTAFPMALMGAFFLLLATGVNGVSTLPYKTDYVPVQEGKGKNAEVVYQPVTRHFTLHWSEVVIIFAVICFAAVVFFYYRWHTTYYMITNMHLKIMSLPPIWLPFLPSSIKNFKLREIDINENEDSAIGNLAGYGGYSGGTKLQEDDPLKHMRWLPNHTTFIEILEDAAEYAKRNNM